MGYKVALVGATGNVGQPVPQMDTDDGKQRQRPHIGNQARQHAATFIGKAGQRRMDPVRVI